MTDNDFLKKFSDFFKYSWLVRFTICLDVTGESTPRYEVLEGFVMWRLKQLRVSDRAGFRAWRAAWGHASFWLPHRLSKFGIRNAAAISQELALSELFFATGCWAENRHKLATDFRSDLQDYMVAELSLGLDHAFDRLWAGAPKDKNNRDILDWTDYPEVRDDRITGFISRDVISKYDPNEIRYPDDPDYRWADISDYWENYEYLVGMQRQWCELCDRTGITYQSFQSLFENREWKHIAYGEGLVTLFQPGLLVGKDRYKDQPFPYISLDDFIEEWKPIFTRAKSLNQPHDEHFEILTEVRQITQKFGSFAWGLDFRGSRYAAAIILAEAGRYEDAIRLMPGLEAVPDYYPEVTAGDDLVHRIAVECFLGMEEGATALSKIVSDGRVERDGRLLYHRVDVSTLFECLIRCRNPEVSKILSPMFKEWNCEDEHRFFLEKGEITLGPWQPYRKN